MKKLAAAVLLPVALILAGTGFAEARPGGGGGGHGARSHSHGGGYYRPGYYRPYYYGPRLFVGAPYPYYYPYPSYYTSPPAYYTAPPVYVEQPQMAPQQQPQQAAPASSGSWYYCESPGGYYPQVQNCTGGWQRVSPQPPG